MPPQPSQNDSNSRIWPSEVYTALSLVGRKSVHPSRFRALTATVRGQAGADLPAERQDDDRMQLELRVMLLFRGELFRQFSGLAAGTCLSTARREDSAQAGLLVVLPDDPADVGVRAGLQPFEDGQPVGRVGGHNYAPSVAERLAERTHRRIPTL